MKPTVGLCLAMLVSPAFLCAGPDKLDTARRAARVSTEQKATLPEAKAPERNEVLMSKPFQTSTVEKKEATLGQRQSPVTVGETKPKELITPERKTYETLERKDSPWTGQESRYATSKDAYRTRVATRFQDKIGEASPFGKEAKPAIKQRTTFDRINRFVFRKNGDQSVSVTTAGSERPAGDASAQSSPNQAKKP